MPHKRSLEGKQKQQARNTKRKQEYLANQLLYNYSLRDPSNNEIVFTQQPYASKVTFGEVTITNATYQDIVRFKINEALGYVPESVFNHEIGEVLNSK